MRSFFALILAIMLGAAPAHAQPDVDPLSFIKAIHKTYKGTEGGLPRMYSRRLQALVDKDAKETPDGYVGRIDWDVFVDAQDTQLTELKIVLVSKSAMAAQVRATFKNFVVQKRAADPIIGAVIVIIPATIRRHSLGDQESLAPLPCQGQRRKYARPPTRAGSIRWSPPCPLPGDG